MTELLPILQKALAERYLVERELGRGASSNRRSAHGRPVFLAPTPPIAADCPSADVSDLL